MAKHTNQFTRIEIPKGAVFGKLTVLKNVGHKNYLSSRIDYYLCRCECGNTKDIRRNHLLAGKTVSCGCHRRSLALKAPGEISFSALFNGCKQSAIVRGLLFKLTKYQHRQIIIQNCHYCNAEPAYFNTSIKVDKTHKKYIPIETERAAIYANGVDRVNSKIGYTLDNCVPCCYDCNMAKAERSKEEFIIHCRKIVAFWESSL